VFAEAGENLAAYFPTQANIAATATRAALGRAVPDRCREAGRVRSDAQGATVAERKAGPLSGDQSVGLGKSFFSCINYQNYA
jgi:hypothetical protein